LIFPGDRTAIAVAGTSVICYALMTGAEKIKRNRRSADDNATDGGSISGSDGWPVASWSGGDSGGGGDGGGGD